MRRISLLTAATVLILLSCGGSQAPAQTGPGDNVHATPTSEGDVEGDVASGPGLAGEATDPMATDGADGATEPAVESEPPPVTFRLVNQASEDLVFSIEKGWQTSFIAFSGKPPNAKPIIMYPKWCTHSCDLAEAERCEVCEEPSTVKEARAAEQRLVIAPGEAHELGWDGLNHVYEDTRVNQDGRRVKCECYRQEMAPPETYTVRACGLRITKVASESTKLQCVDATMTLPSDSPQVITIEFPAP